MASGSIAAFNPESTVSVTAGTTSVAAEISGPGPSLLVYNASGSTAFLRLGASTTTTTATTADMPVPPASRVLLGVGATVCAAAVILQTGTGLVFLTRGSGSVY